MPKPFTLESQGGFVYWSSHRFAAGESPDFEPRLFVNGWGTRGNGYAVNTIIQTNVIQVGLRQFGEPEGAILFPVGRFRIDRVMWDVSSEDEESRERVWRSSSWAFEGSTVLVDACPLTTLDIGGLLGNSDERVAELESRIKLLTLGRSKHTLTGLRVLQPHFLAATPFTIRLRTWTPINGQDRDWCPKTDVHVRFILFGHDGGE